MKEYKTNLMKINWSMGHIILIPVLALVDYLLYITVTNTVMIPAWLNSAGSIMGACIAGPAYGVVIALIGGTISVLLGGGTGSALSMLAVIFTVIFIGTYVRLGFFGNLKGVFLAVIFNAFAVSCIWAPVNLALHGGIYKNNILMIKVFELCTEAGMTVPVCSVVSFIIAEIVDMGIILLAVYGIAKIVPESIMEKLGFVKQFPQVTIVDRAEDAEFVSESDKLKEKAQERLDKKKADEEAAQADKGTK